MRHQVQNPDLVTFLRAMNAEEPSRLSKCYDPASCLSLSTKPQMIVCSELSAMVESRSKISSAIFLYVQTQFSKEEHFVLASA
jgi:hypothetical protein